MLEMGYWVGVARIYGKNFDVKLDCITISKKQAFQMRKERIL